MKWVVTRPHLHILAVINWVIFINNLQTKILSIDYHCPILEWLCFYVNTQETKLTWNWSFDKKDTVLLFVSVRSEK